MKITYENGQTEEYEDVKSDSSIFIIGLYKNCNIRLNNISKIHLSLIKINEIFYLINFRSGDIISLKESINQIIINKIKISIEIDDIPTLELVDKVYEKNNEYDFPILKLELSKIKTKEELYTIFGKTISK